jgi:S1-C subfamily serine protease
MKKSVVSLTLAVLMLLCAFPLNAVAAGSLTNFTKKNTYTPGQFTDVQNQWFAPYVQAAYEYGLVNGSSATTFSPEKNLTVAEAIKIAACMHSIFYSGAANFPAGSPWYQPYVDYALNNGIIAAAYPSYTEPTTRADFAVIFANALPGEALTPINTIDDNTIPDVLVSYSYGPAVYKLYRAGVLTGSDSAGTFYPNSYITRDAVSAIAARMVNASYRQTLTLTQKALSATEISAKCAPAVFYIEVLNKYNEPILSGSGFFISSDGLAVTNYHVIRNMINAKITTKDGQTYDIAGVVDYDAATDLALIKVNGSGFPYLTLGNSDTAATGATIYTIGYPLGVTQTVAPGAITNAAHLVDDISYIMISAPISSGSSGGALINSTGQVIGVTNASYSDGQNLNLAVPINLLGGLSRDKTPVPLSELFKKSFTCYASFPTIPDFISLNGSTSTFYRQGYEAVFQATYYMYAPKNPDDIYLLRNDYLDLLVVEGFTYFSSAVIGGYDVYNLADPSEKWSVSVGVITENGKEYIIVMVMPL